MAHDVKKKLNKLQWLVGTSPLKTLAIKHKTSVVKITAKHKLKGEVKVVLNNKEYEFFRLKILKKPSWTNLDQLPNGHFFHWKKTSLEKESLPKNANTVINRMGTLKYTIFTNSKISLNRRLDGKSR